jgi:hypothetical protein
MEASILELEKLRKKAAFLLAVIITTASFASIFMIILLFYRGMKEVSFILSIILGIGLGFLLGKITGFFDLSKEYKKRFKATFVEVPFREHFSSVTYYGVQGIDKDVIKETGLMTLGNIYQSNDYVQGFCNNVKFERADVKIQQHVSTGKTSYTITYLHGRWLIFNFNKVFHSDLQIIAKDFDSAQKKNSIFTGSEDRRHRIRLEDEEFNTMFRVYCQDDHEAYFILTPHFMSMLKDLQRRIDGSIMLGFVDHQLHVAIHNNKDAMEPKIWDEVDFYSIKEEVQKEINVITDIINSLNLEKDIYKN